jgi:hypothetical protein
MYSAASELSIMQDIDKNGSIITKFSRTNQTDKELVNIRGISKHGKAYVRQTVVQRSTQHSAQRSALRSAHKNYVLPEERIIHLLTKSNTQSLMRNLNEHPQHFLAQPIKNNTVKRSPKTKFKTKKTAKRSPTLKKIVKKSHKPKKSIKKSAKKTGKKNGKKSGKKSAKKTVKK